MTQDTERSGRYDRCDSADGSQLPPLPAQSMPTQRAPRHMPGNGRSVADRRSAPHTPHGFGGGTLLADPAVDAFAQRVGVPAMAGVLVDAVDPQFADGDAALADSFTQIGIFG